MPDTSKKKPSIAIVEDNPDNLLLLRVLLQDQYALDEYGDGVQAVEGIVRSPPDLVLMDISLPHMNGVEALHQLRRHGLNALPIVALTAHAMVGDREHFLAEGFDYYIAKPILDRLQITEPIEQLLAGLDVA